MSSVKKAWIAKSKDYSEVKEDLERRKLKFKDYLISVEEMNEDDLECITRIFHIEKEDGEEYYKCSISYYNLLEYKNATIEELQENLAEAKEELEEPEEELEEMPEKVNLPQVRIWGGTEEYLSPLCQTEGTLLSKGDAVGLTSTVKLASEVQAPWQKGRSWAS